MKPAKNDRRRADYKSDGGGGASSESDLARELWRASGTSAGAEREEGMEEELGRSDSIQLTRPETTWLTLLQVEHLSG